jgi:hypothetical protein
MRPLFGVAVAVVLFSPSFCSAQSIYRVSIDTSRLKGSSGMLVFDMTSNTPVTNRFDVINFITDGAIDSPETQGQFILGDLVQHLLPAKFTRINADTFFTELALPFITFGELISFTINVSETAPFSGRPPDELSLYLLGEGGRTLGPATKGNPNVSITITGERGGRLQVLPKGSGASETAEQSDQANQDRNVAEYVQQRAVTFAVTPAWIQDDPTLFQNAQTFEGILTVYCDRRCAGTTSCTGGAYGVALDKEDTFYPLDDVSGLKAQVALVESGKNPLTEGQLGHAKVVGIVKDSVLILQSITLF